MIGTYISDVDRVDEDLRRGHVVQDSGASEGELGCAAAP